MATKKKAEVTKERAAVGRERRLALSLVAMIEAYVDGTTPFNETARKEAIVLLDELGYSGLESTAKRLVRINEELTQAIKDGNGARISELGRELEKTQAGKFRKTATPSASDADGK